MEFREIPEYRLQIQNGLKVTKKQLFVHYLKLIRDYIVLTDDELETIYGMDHDSKNQMIKDYNKIVKQLVAII